MVWHNLKRSKQRNSCIHRNATSSIATCSLGHYPILPIINFNEPCKCSVKEVLGFNPDVFQNEDVHGVDFVHPEDLKMLLQAIKYRE